ncbi:DsbA family protein [Pseudogracilibacillus sp. SE30717A]|uniref:DsbA family protein n=1 Tax=Pseudogracilibacillus sp. SE30717A TaxID=3098293 RepID=UPI00300E6BC0
MNERGIHMDAYDVQNETTHSSTIYPFIKFVNKPVLIYYFVDPFCYDCWSIENSLKKMTMNYGGFFNVRPIISHTFCAKMNRSKKRYLFEQSSRYYLSLGIKAAGLQGNKAGRDFLRNIQEELFLYQKSETADDIMYQAAIQSQLDINEFTTDLTSSTARNAYQRDIRLIEEMDVTYFPTFVFLSQYIDDYSVKVSGLHSYESYVYVLKTMLQTNLHTKQQNIPPLEIYLRNYKRVQAEEVAFIFDLSLREAEKQLKKLQLEQKVKRVVGNNKVYWEYIE